jgi:flagellar biosynthetic protein FlhB
MSDPSKTEEATPRRQNELRNKGQTVKSQELNAAVLFLVAIFFMRAYLPQLVSYIRSETYQLWHTLPKDITLEGFLALMRHLTAGMLQALTPLFIAMIITAVIVNIGQVGLNFTTYPLRPDLSKLNPIPGFKRLFSKQPFVQLAQNLLKIGFFLWIASSILRRNYVLLLQTVHMPLGETGALLGRITWEICWKLALTMLVLAVIDVIWQRWSYKKSIRMSQQEVKDETKNSEGDPQIKARIRQLQRKAAMKRMMESVPRADVVLTNPTHLAVAIEYKPDSMAAPQVVAKGAEAVAERIKAIAREHDVPILENKPLARALFRNTEVGDEIPADLYNAVSEVLIYVYQMTGRLEEFSNRPSN